MTDRFAGGAGSMNVRLLGRRRARRYGSIPCGGDAHDEKRFGDIVIPSRLTAGWWYGTPRYDPFFEAEIHAAQPCAGAA